MELLVEVLEASMVVLFGISSPMNIVKSIRTKSAKGKSLLFLVFILAGYVGGIAGKLAGHFAGIQPLNWVFAFYVLNLIMVSVDLILTVINRRRESGEKGR